MLNQYVQRWLHWVLSFWPSWPRSLATIVHLKPHSWKMRCYLWHSGDPISSIVSYLFTSGTCFPKVLCHSLHLEYSRWKACPKMHLNLTCHVWVHQFHLMFKTQWNKFGLFHVFRSEGLPSHDPNKQFIIMQSFLSQLPFTANSSIPPITSTPNNPFHPYPNKSSLRLGDWYWNHGLQKSHQNFKLLLDIIGDLEYNPDNVRNTDWKTINKELGSGSGDGPEASAGWSCSPITISIPFHCQTPNPGPCDYTILDFHHHHLLSIIHEKLSDSFHHCVYHHEPYKLCLHLPNKACDVRVHGELYTSGAFIKAQEQLLALPCKQDCELSRCIVALMFWSDAMQLTLLRSTKLWPLYLYFGNQSKYMCCQPSSNLCSHVSYFQSVSYFLWVWLLTIVQWE